MSMIYFTHLYKSCEISKQSKEDSFHMRNQHKTPVFIKACLNFTPVKVQTFHIHLKAYLLLHYLCQAAHLIFRDCAAGSPRSFGGLRAISFYIGPDFQIMHTLTKHTGGKNAESLQYIQNNTAVRNQTAAAAARKWSSFLGQTHNHALSCII